VVSPNRSSTALDLVILGFSAAIAQAVLVREAMGTLGGSELAWGMVLGAWLGGMGIGAWAGAHRPASPTCLPLTMVVLAAGGVVLLRAAPALLGRSPGEVSSTVRAAWTWLAAVTPAAVAGGVAFASLAARLLPQREAAGRAYSLESAGAVLGGLTLTFLLASRGSMAGLCVTAGLTSAVQLVVRRRRWLALTAAVLGLGLAWPAENALAVAGWHWAGHPGELETWRNTRQQRVELSAGQPAALYADGRLLAVLPDPYRASLRGHLLALLHPAPRRVLLVGTVPGEMDRQLLRHPIERLDEVVEDAGLLALVEGARALSPLPAGDAGRRHFVVSDPLRAVRHGGPWDLVILADADPATMRQNRTRTVEFVREAAAALAPQGVLAMRVGVGDTYLAGAGGRLLAVLHATLREALPATRAIPGEEVWLLGSQAASSLETDAGILAGRWRERSIPDELFTPEMLPLLLDPDRAASLQRCLDAARGEVNTVARPRAVLLAATLLEGRADGAVARWLSRIGNAVEPLAFAIGLAWVAWLLVSGIRRRAPRVGVAALVGVASMGWWLLLMAAWQATRGSVYAEVGALSAAFMAGIWVGSRWSSRQASRATALLPMLLLAGAVLSLGLATGMPRRWPIVVVPLLLVVAGGLTGAAFPGLAAWPECRGRALGAGRGFAADEIGAAGGATVLGVVVLPVLGSGVAAVGLAFLLAAAAAGAQLTLRGRMTAGGGT